METRELQYKYIHWYRYPILLTDDKCILVITASFLAGKKKKRVTNLDECQKQAPEVFYKKSVPKNFTKISENACARVSFLKEMAATLLKKRL